MSDLSELQAAVGEWSDEMMGPGPRLATGLEHLRRELAEIEADPKNPEEYADALMILYDVARREGITAPMIRAAAFRKLEINKTRRWAAGADGVIEHVKETKSGKATDGVQRDRLDRMIGWGQGGNRCVGIRRIAHGAVAVEALTPDEALRVLLLPDGTWIAQSSSIEAREASGTVSNKP